MDLQLLFVLLFLVISVFDAISRKKKNQGRMEEMEREESAADEAERMAREAAAEARWRARQQSGGTPRQESGGVARQPSGGATSRAPEVPPPPPSAPERRETADSMIPEDLWAILTGGQLPPHTPIPPPRAPLPPREESAHTEGYREEPQREEVPRWEENAHPEVETRDQPRWEDEARSQEASRSREASKEKRPDVGQRAGVPAGPGARFPAPRRADSLQRVPLPRGGRPVPVPSPIPRPIEEGFGALSDITAGEIGSGEGRVLSRAAYVGTPGRGTSSPYLSLLRSEGREGLRRAIVLQEVLGPPVSLRPAEKRVWEVWEG